jgi:hypothetical protein
MEENILQQLSLFFGWKHAIVSNFGTGLINHTWKIIHEEDEFILQQINTHIFKQPILIDDNFRLLSNYFQQHHPAYLFVAPVKGSNDESIITINENYYRCFPFIRNSHTIDVVQNPQQAYEAAKQFAKFTSLLNEFNAERLHITLNDFHNLSLRYHQFEKAIFQGNAERISESKNEIQFIQSKQPIVKKYEDFIQHKELKKRVTHHDTKISNVLFDEADKGLCVIDLDTVMPGYFISDVGDMMRTYVCPVSEEENDFDKIRVRADFIKSIQEGYFSEMKHALSSFEQDHFLFAGEFLIYMQAIRFLTDYLTDDVYYGSKYPKHNLFRAKNQMELLRQYRDSIG